MLLLPVVALAAAFEPNVGQAPVDAPFVAHTRDGFLAIGSTGVQRGPLRLQWSGARRQPGNGRQVLPGVVNYYLGDDPSRWRERVPRFGRVEFFEILPGVDLVYRLEGDAVEYDLRLEAGVDPEGLALVASRGTVLTIEEGQLVATFGSERLVQRAPVVFQGQRRLPSSWRLRGANEAGFDVGERDSQLPLLVDPVLSWSSYLGGSGSDRANAVLVVPVCSPLCVNNALFVGATNSTNYPVASATQIARQGGFDAVVTHINAQTNTLVFSTYLGGTGDDEALAVAPVAGGDFLFAGFTLSNDFPTLTAAQPASGGGQDAVVFRLGSSGTLQFSTYFGGSSADVAYGVSSVPNGVLFAGHTASTNLPVVGALQATNAGGNDVLLARLSADGSTLLASTYLGGSMDDLGYGLATDPNGFAYLTGITLSPNFPTTASAVQTTPGGAEDAFAARVSPAGNQLLYATYLGGTGYESGHAIRVIGSEAVVAGETSSTNFPTRSPFQGTLSGQTDGFLTRLNSTGSALVLSTYFGGTNIDVAWDVRLDSLGRVYFLGGYTTSTNLPVTANPPLQTLNAGGGGDAFVSALAASADGGAPTLALSTYLGGSGEDYATGLVQDGTQGVWVAGRTSSTDFPIRNGLQTTNDGGTTEGFLARIATVELDGGADAGQPDGGADAGVPDAGVPDAGASDAGLPDGGGLDGGADGGPAFEPPGDAGELAPQNLQVACGCSSTTSFIAILGVLVCIAFTRRHRT